MSFIFFIYMNSLKSLIIYYNSSLELLIWNPLKHLCLTMNGCQSLWPQSLKYSDCRFEFYFRAWMFAFFNVFLWWYKPYHGLMLHSVSPTTCLS